MLWVLFICGLALLLTLLLCGNPRNDRPVHHDSRIGSFYEISNRKDS